MEKTHIVELRDRELGAYISTYEMSPIQLEMFLSIAKDNVLIGVTTYQ